MKDNGCVDDLFEISFENGIACFIFKPIHVDLKLAQRFVTRRLELFKENTFPVFLDLSNFISMDSAARRYIASAEGGAQINARAIYTDNPLIKLASEVFIYVNEPSVITRVFTDRAEALNWLSQFKGRHSTG